MGQGIAKCLMVIQNDSLKTTHERPLKHMYGFETMIPMEVGQHFDHSEFYSKGPTDEQ